MTRVAMLVIPPSPVNALLVNALHDNRLPRLARIVLAVMSHSLLSSRSRTWRLASIIAAVAVAAAATRSGISAALGNPVEAPHRAELVNVPFVRNGSVAVSRAIDFDSLSGRSGDLRMRLLTLDDVEAFPSLVHQVGADVRNPGIHTVTAPARESPFAFVTLTPWRRKIGSYVNGYHVGLWPGELRTVSASYDSPEGFIEVTSENADTRVSTHFTLRDFITHDQAHVWPKYVVLREELLDKLELVLDALESFGIETRHVVVLSGFRTPQYNAQGGGEGMARSSRHQFGDAADIIIDADRDGRMDDLNRDGVVDFADAQVVDRAVQLVEHRNPDLVGGLGLYHEMGPSGPFVHIDVRGTRARWTNRARPGGGRAVAAQSSGVASGAVRLSGTCQADGAMSVLCRGSR